MTGALTLVVFTGNGPAADVPDVLRAWSGEGLLHDVLLVPNDEGADAPVPTAGVLLSQGEAVETDIVEALATRDLTLLRLVRIRLVADTCEPDPAVDRLADRLEARLAGGHQSLLRINLVVLVRDDVPIPVEAFRALWPVNVVVSPEDRRTERHGAADVMTRLPAHAALAVVSAGALWSQMVDGPFDRSVPEQGSSPRSVLISRSWARVLVGGSALRQVVEQVFAIRRTQPDTLARAASGVVTRDAGVVVERATVAYLRHTEGGALNYVVPPSLPAPVPVTIGLLEALRRMFRFLWAEIRRLPATVLDTTERAVTGRLERAVQAFTFGSDSTVVTAFAGRQHAPLPSAQVGDPATAVRQYAQSLLMAMELPETPAATPGAWRDLRMILFGLHDGGPLPSYVEPPVSGAVREIVTDLDRLAAPPSEEPVLLAEYATAEDAHAAPLRTPLRECDPYQAEATRAWLEEKLRDVAPDPADDGIEDDDSDTEPPVEESTDDADSRRQGLERALAVLDDWVAQRADTPGWRVAAHLMAEIKRAGSGLEGSLAALRTYVEPDDDADHARARQQLMRWWWAILAGAATMVIWWLLSRRMASAEQPLLHELGRYGVRLGWRIVLVTALVASLGWFASFLRYQRTIFRLLHRHNLRQHRFSVAVRDAEHDSRQVVRLAALYEQARDWGEIVAWMLHRPEGPARGAVPEGRPPTRLETPLAFARAAGQATAGSLQRVASQVANDRYQRGWLSQLYSEYLEHAMSALAHQRGLDVKSVRFDPDIELADPKRAQFAAAVRAGTPSELWRSEVTRDARAHLARTDPEDLFPEVVHLDGDQPGTVIPAQRFLHDILPSEGALRGALPLLATFWSRSAVFSDRHRTTAVHVWLPESAQPTGTGGGLTRHRVVISPRDADGFMLQAIRVDVAGPVPWDDVAIGSAVAAQAEDAPWDVPPPKSGAL